MLKVTSEGKMVETTRLQEVSSLRLSQNGLRRKKRTSGSLPAVLVVRHVIHQFYTHASLQNTFSY